MKSEIDKNANLKEFILPFSDYSVKQSFSQYQKSTDSQRSFIDEAVDKFVATQKEIDARKSMQVQKHPKIP